MGNPLFQYPVIDGCEHNSFATFTIKQRFPAIIRRIVEDNNYQDVVNTSLINLAEQVNSGKFSHTLQSVEDQAQWNAWMSPYQSLSWFEVPFYFAEACFYRLILDRTGYFEHRMDPFYVQKKQDATSNKRVMEAILQELELFINNQPPPHQLLNMLLLKCLWGNKSDLSQLNLDRERNEIANQTLINDTYKIAPLFDHALDRIDIVLDNSGLELFTDLLMADKLVDSGLVRMVVLHAKAHPTFVSDATVNDVQGLIELLGEMEHKSAKRMKDSLDLLLKSGKTVIKTHEFWNYPLHFFDMPDDLRSELEQSKLIIFKGDANYRRVFGDRVLPHDLKPEQLANYLPLKSLAIRILKSEIVVGLESKILESMDELDKNWMINGKYGMIQALN